MFFTPRNDRVVSVYEPFEQPMEDAESLAEELDVLNRARRAAREEQPATDAREPDSHERFIEQKLAGKLIQAHNRARENLGVLASAIGDVNISRELHEMEAVESSYEQDVETRLQPLLRELESERRRYVALQDDYQDFRRQHRISRQPCYPASRTWQFAVLAFILLVESVMNGVFFAEGSDAGLLGGVVQALTVAAVNVSLGVAAGWGVLRYTHHIRIPRRVLAWLGFLVLIALALVVNLGAAHYREALMQDPDNAARLAITTFRQDPLGMSDFQSWLLFGLGLLFHVIAILDGYAMDDPYPGYGALARACEQAQADLYAARIEAMTELEVLFNDYEYQLEDHLRHIAAAHKTMTTLLKEKERIEQLLEDYRLHLCQTQVYLVRLYRDTNEAERSTPPPAYFASTEPSGMPSGVEPLEVPDRLAELTAARDRVAARMAEARNRMLAIRERWQEKLDEVYGR